MTIVHFLLLVPSLLVHPDPPPLQTNCSHESVIAFPSFNSPDAEKINWKERRLLTWTDFKAAPVESAPNAALTSTSILFGYHFGEGGLTYTLQCVFYPHKSWTKVRSERILSHEQGHFDISELFTRKLHQALAAYKPRENSLEPDINAIYQKVAQDQAAYQKQYDTETNYSRDLEGQSRWSQRIRLELEQLQKFAGYPQPQ
ncbi:DUF922 domain-containing protein [Flavihumibacter petaseus]|uniref:DUF922 domain-containing protein n=1 Tax=Flavihumibacter petaseus NBRC 106054 TaxID=1220578 RepID=A0A0E9MUN6_9BACT|nr:DUF922 domain-containing protein [Flavihumibacter petaseus]GAO41289.1 hypothetical protein FPE01S_01_03010 [Flavihumibacter petaseus NBRC 106054]